MPEEPPQIITVNEAKLSIFGNTSATVDAADLAQYIAAATSVIEELAGPQLARQEIIQVQGGRDAIALPWPVRSATATINGTAVTVRRVSNRAGVLYGPFPHGDVVITAQLGYEEIPPNVKLAARELVRTWWQQGRQGNRPAFGNSADTADTSNPGDEWAVPRRVRQLLKGARKIGGFA